MLEKIKKFFRNMLKRYKYSRCYDFHEGRDAVFGMCHCDDIECPYNIYEYQKFPKYKKRGE